MVLHGKIKNGVVVFDPAIELPEGAEVLVQTINGKPWMKSAGSISEKDARAMTEYIEKHFEKVEPEEQF